MIKKHLDTVSAVSLKAQLSEVEQLSISSYLANGHPVHLYSYEEVTGVPAGTIVHDAAEILPRRSGTLPDGSTAPFLKEWLRLELAAKTNAWVTSLDMICLKPLDLPDPLVLGFENPNKIGTAIIRFPPHHKILTKILRALRYPQLTFPYSLHRWKAVGQALLHCNSAIMRHFDSAYLVTPEYMTFLVLDTTDSLLVKSPALFYPVPAGNMDILYNSEIDTETYFKGTYTLQLHDIELPLKENRKAAANTPLGTILQRYQQPI